MSKESYREKFAMERSVLRPQWSEWDSENTDQSLMLPQPEWEKTFSGETIALPSVNELDFNTGLQEAIINRKSTRKFSQESLTAEELSFLLYSSMGVRKQTDRFCLRTVPSAGARQALDLYVYISRVEGIPSGLYYYSGLKHSITFVKNVTPETVSDALMGQLFGSAVVLIWTAHPYKMEYRYTTVAHKLIALDAGHSCQNTYLAATAIGCGCCAIGAYDQAMMDGMLEIDGTDEFAIYMATIGKLI